MIWQFVALLVTHWVADFVLQTHWQATNKSKNSMALIEHVAVYSATLAVCSIGIFGLHPDMALFLTLNAALHFGTDFCTSRASAKLRAKQDWHNFFVVIGFDRLIHQVTLAVTIMLIMPIRLTPTDTCASDTGIS
jgi:hypothetical protein